MRTLCLILLLFPLLSIGQTSSVFIKLTDNKGQQIMGEVQLKGFERAIQATSMNSSGKNNTRLDFTMQVGGASADLRRMMSSGQPLTKAEVFVVVPGMQAPVVSYKINMEQISVIGCTDQMSCNSAMGTTVSLQAGRIGWTYYSTGRTGATSISRKFGWDAIAGAEWTSF